MSVNLTALFEPDVALYTKHYITNINARSHFEDDSSNDATWWILLSPLIALLAIYLILRVGVVGIAWLARTWILVKELEWEGGGGVLPIVYNASPSDSVFKNRDEYVSLPDDPIF